MSDERIIEEAWMALRRGVEQRAQALAQAVRAYPGPIARCDEQLPAMIAARDAAVRLAAAAESADAGAHAPGRTRRLLRFAASLPTDDDADLARLRDAVLGAGHARSP